MSEPIEVPDVPANWWKPSAVGERMTGQLAGVVPSSFGQAGLFAPAIVWDRDGKAEVLAEVRIGLNWSLRNRIVPDRIGQVLGLTLSERISTKAGMANRFRVLHFADPATVAAFGAKVRQMSEGALDLHNVGPEAADPIEEAADDLPF